MAPGQNVEADGPDDADVRVDVAFVRDAGTYRATIVSAGRVEGVRSIVDQSASCAALAQAVVASLVVHLDSMRDAQTPLPPAPEPERFPEDEPAAPPTPPAPHAVDRADTPPFDRPTRSGDDARSASVRGASRWYGWQIGIADATAILGMVVGWSASGAAANDLGDLSLVGFVFAGPVIHNVHRRPGALLTSLGLRLGLPSVGAIVGGVFALLEHTCPTESATGPQPPLAEGLPCVPGVEGLAVGALVGALAASAADVALLGWESRTNPHPASGARVTPWLGWSGPESARRLSAGIGGVF